jgi:hypothetical protein
MPWVRPGIWGAYTDTLSELGALSANGSPSICTFAARYEGTDSGFEKCTPMWPFAGHVAPNRRAPQSPPSAEYGERRRDLERHERLALGHA